MSYRARISENPLTHAIGAQYLSHEIPIANSSPANIDRPGQVGMVRLPLATMSDNRRSAQYFSRNNPLAQFVGTWEQQGEGRCSWTTSHLASDCASPCQMTRRRIAQTRQLAPSTGRSPLKDLSNNRTSEERTQAACVRFLLRLGSCSTGVPQMYRDNGSELLRFPLSSVRRHCLSWQSCHRLGARSQTMRGQLPVIDSSSLLARHQLETRGPELSSGVRLLIILGYQTLIIAVVFALFLPHHAVCFLNFADPNQIFHFIKTCMKSGMGTIEDARQPVAGGYEARHNAESPVSAPRVVGNCSI